MKLNPDDKPSPPNISACQPPLTAVCTAVELPHPFSMSATSNRIVTTFMNCPWALVSAAKFYSKITEMRPDRSMDVRTRLKVSDSRNGFYRLSSYGYRELWISQAPSSA